MGHISRNLARTMNYAENLDKLIRESCIANLKELEELWITMGLSTEEIDERMDTVRSKISDITTEMVGPPTPSRPLATVPQTYQPTMPAHTTIQQGNTVAQMDESYGDDGYDYGGYEGEEGYEGGMMNISGEGGDQNKAVLLHGASQLCQKNYKNYSCLSCGKTFTDQSNCKRHIRIKHLGEEMN